MKLIITQKHALFIILLLTSQLYSMQQKPVSFYVLNKTGGKVSVSALLGDKKPENSTLVVGQELEFRGDLPDLKSLTVEPHGKVKGWGSLSAITGGISKPANIAEEPVMKKAREANLAVRIIVESGKERAYNVLGRYGGLVEPFMPYEYNYERIEIDPYVENYVKTTLFKELPQVQKALDEQAVIFPRYVLNVAEKALEDDVVAAYARINKKWEPLLSSSDSDESVLAQKVLALAKAARDKMLGRNNEFDELVKQELKAPTAYTIGKPVVEATLVGDLTIVPQKQSKHTKEERESMEQVDFVYYDNPQ